MRVAGTLRQVGWHNVNSPDGEPSGRKPGYGINVAGVVKVLGTDQINWQVVTGTAIATYMNDGGEYIWGKHESKDGASATDYRLQWSTRVTF